MKPVLLFCCEILLPPGFMRFSNDVNDIGYKGNVPNQWNGST
jgi:hypothetical protein